MTKKILVVFVSIMVVFGIVCTDAVAKKIFITMSTASTGGGWYPAGSNLAQLWNEKIPTIKANSQASKGSVQNVDLLRRKDVNLCWMQNNIARQSYRGTGRFKDKPHKNFRMAMVMFPSQYHILASKASGIKKIADIKGKRFIPGRPGSGNISSSAAVFGTFGFGHKDYKIDYAGQTEAVQAVQDGRVDGTFLVGGAPLGPLSAALFTAKDRLYLLDMTEEERKAVNSKHPWIVPFSLTPHHYPTLPEAGIKTLGHSAFIMCREDMPEDIIYQIVKTTYDNLDSLRGVNKVFNNMDIGDLAGAMGLQVPLHPGAMKYYKEAGALK
jgi:TRAP transporter TAXI family solute receptor